MKKLIAIFSAVILCATMAGCSGIEYKTTVTTQTSWDMDSESGMEISEYVVVDGVYYEVPPYGNK